MAERQVTHQNIISLLGKLDDPDADLRYMSLNDIYGILTSIQSSFISGESRVSQSLADGLLKALDDQHGDVQNQALKCFGPLASRIPLETLVPLLEKLADLTSSTTIDTSVPNTALRTIVDTLPRPQAGQPAPKAAVMAYSAISKVLIPRLTGPTKSASGRRGSVVRGMLEKDASGSFSSESLDVLIRVVTCFGPLLQEHELVALQEPVMEIIYNDTAGTVVTKRALAAIAVLVLHFPDPQLDAFVARLAQTLSSPTLTAVRRRHLIAAIGTIARSAPAKIGPHLNTLLPFVLSAVGEDNVTVH